MLQSIHDKAKGILGIIIVAFLALVFGLWGIGDYLTGATEKFAAKVDDVEISQTQFEQGLARQRQRMQEMFQGQVPDSPVFQQRMKEQVLEQLITRQVMQKMVADNGYRVADAVLIQKIKNMKAFQQDGAFDSKSYQAAVQSQGMVIREFENLFRNDLVVQQLPDSVSRSSIIGDVELNIFNQIQQQSREINYLQFDDINFLAEIKVSDDQVNEYYELNRTRYMHPEMVSISYVELTSDNLAKDIPVDEKAVRQLYDQYVTSVASKEQRKAQHILINLSAGADAETQQQKKAQIESLLARINKGESFDTLAKENSEDPGSAPNGGDLGWVSKGMMMPEFEAALFKLKKGQVSDVVKSSFGYHLIRFNEVKSSPVASFESKKSELVRQFKAQMLEDGFYEQSELMATTAYENDQSLQDVADALDLQIKSTEAFSRQQGKGIAANAKVRAAAFNSEVMSEGRNSDIIEISKNHVLVLRVDTHSEAKAKSLDEVKHLIKAAISTEKAREKSMASALEALAKLETGESIESKSVTASAKLTKLGLVKRDSSGADKQILSQAFTMSKPTADKALYKVVETATGTAVIELKAIVSPEQATSEQLQVLAKQMSNEQANRDMTAVLDYLKSQSTIKRAEEL
jgi:peptidyl-prolyl cis-trans isomerase D